jgi:tetratricopeptide (TPR) repeat protein
MLAPKLKSFHTASLTLAFLALLTWQAPPALGQFLPKQITPTIETTISDSQNNPQPGATVTLKSDTSPQPRLCTTNSEGKCRFEDLPSGKYTLQVKLSGYLEANRGPFNIAGNQVSFVHIQLKREVPQSAKIAQPPPADYSDEPEFTVSSVTDPANEGGHGSDAVVRTTEALARDTARLNGIESGRAPQPSPAPEGAELHAVLGDKFEREGHPLDAVREYQRAAELDPNEPNLFALGSELLLHFAPAPASEVFTKGHRLFPASVRMFVGLGAASYALGSSERATQQLLDASDLDPANPAPYLFLGKIQDAEKIASPAMLERFRRFVKLQPENAQAYYYYAVGLTNQDAASENFAQIESLLLKAVALDPHLGDAYLHLGILYSRQNDFPKAIAAYQMAIENTPLPADAHYRLAQTYRQIGRQQQAALELDLFTQISQQKTQEAERNRREIGQFVYTLRSQPAPRTTPAPNPQ